MPCTDGGAPVTMERLLGLVKLGTTQSPMVSVPCGSICCSQGIWPPRMASVRYAGSQPSTQMTTTGATGQA